MTLQEQIARRLSGMGPDWDDINGLEFTEAVMRRAAEVERWMEWAFMTGVAVGSRGTDRNGLPLTLPPEDWKP